MKKDEHDYDYHNETYLKEFDLWLQAEEVRAQSLQYDINSAEESIDITKQMLELQEEKIHNAKSERDQYLLSLRGEMNE